MGSNSSSNSNSTYTPTPNNGQYSFTPQGQTPVTFTGNIPWGIDPMTGDLTQMYPSTGTGSPYGDPSYNGSAYGTVNKTMPNISPYTGGVSASNPFPSHMTQYNYSGNAPFTFNEQYYLQQNPDVAAAVQAGQFPSGQAHYQQYGQAEGRMMNSNMPTADPNRIPYSTTNPYEVNPYLNFDVNRAYAVPAPIMNGTWNNLTLPTNIWKPTSYVNQVDQARENVARSDLYNPATPTADTSPNTSIGALPVQGNTAGWQRSDVDATLAPQMSMADMGDAPAFMNQMGKRVRLSPQERRANRLAGIQEVKPILPTTGYQGFSYGMALPVDTRRRPKDPRGSHRQGLFG